MSHGRFGKDVRKDGFEIEEGIGFVTEGDAFSGTKFLKYMESVRKLFRELSFEISSDRKDKNHGIFLKRTAPTSISFGLWPASG